MKKFRLDRGKKIYVAGHRGLVGSAIVRTLEAEGFTNILTRSHKELDLTVQYQVKEFFKSEKPEYVILAAAKVGGIHANRTYPVEFMLKNLQIQCNVMESAYENQVEKLLFLGSSCIYPRDCRQPIEEKDLLTSPLEETNEAYALAKITGLKLCQYYKKQYGANFISAMPCNLYGINDNFDLESSHVLPALLRKFHEAVERKEEEITLWGTGAPLREFLYVDDLAQACLFLMEQYQGEEWINVGAGREVTIKELAELIQEITGFTGKINWDTSMPDGTYRKVMDSSKLRNLGWQPKTRLEEGIRKTYEWYCAGRNEKSF